VRENIALVRGEREDVSPSAKAFTIAEACLSFPKKLSVKRLNLALNLIEAALNPIAFSSVRITSFTEET
jgi:hypothetical protein